jgi:hypothetical protein
MWIDLRGRQHRVYYRNPLPEKPNNRDYVAFFAEDDARKFIALAGQLGLATALAVTNEPDEVAATAIVARALATRAPLSGLVNAGAPMVDRAVCVGRARGLTRGAPGLTGGHRGSRGSAPRRKP